MRERQSVSRIPTYTHIHIYTCMHTCIHTCMHRNILTNLHTYVYVNVHKYILYTYYVYTCMDLGYPDYSGEKGSSLTVSCFHNSLPASITDVHHRQHHVRDYIHISHVTICQSTVAISVYMMMMFLFLHTQSKYSWCGIHLFI